MFDIGWQELFIIAVVGIIVIGPKELPRAARAVAGLVRKARSMAHDFQDGVDDMIRQADMEDIKKQVSQTGEDFKNRIGDTVDPDGTIRKDLDLTEFDDDLDAYDREGEDDKDDDEASADAEDGEQAERLPAPSGGDETPAAEKSNAEPEGDAAPATVKNKAEG